MSTTPATDVPGASPMTAALLADDCTAWPTCPGCGEAMRPRLMPTPVEGQWYDHPPIEGRPGADMTGHAPLVLQPARILIANDVLAQPEAGNVLLLSDTHALATRAIRTDDPTLADVVNRDATRLLLLTVEAAEQMPALRSQGVVTTSAATVLLLDPFTPRDQADRLAAGARAGWVLDTREPADQETLLRLLTTLADR